MNSFNAKYFLWPIPDGMELLEQNNSVDQIRFYAWTCDATLKDSDTSNTVAVWRKKQVIENLKQPA